MRQYIRAEWGLYRQNRIKMIVGGAFLFLYGLLLLFAGIMGESYIAISTMAGNVAIVCFLFPMYFAPVEFWRSRKKQRLSTEQLVLMLGESKRIFLLIRLCAWVVLYFGILLFTAVIQLPAALIARESYGISCFAIEVSLFSAFFFSILIPPCIIQFRYLLFIWSGFIGFQAGIMIGYFDGKIMYFDGDGEESLLPEVAVLAVFWFVLAVAAFLFRYFRTIRQEQGGRKQ